MSDVEEVPSADLFKAIASLILFIIALIGGILPQRLQNVGSKVVSCLNTAAGGVFFASAMVRCWVPEVEKPGLGGGRLYVFSCVVGLWGLYALLCLAFVVLVDFHHVSLLPMCAPETAQPPRGS